eukprot:COSAG02_NODE_5075_length_4661_cov_4.005261_3_plen_90_part_00
MRKNWRILERNLCFNNDNMWCHNVLLKVLQLPALVAGRSCLQYKPGMKTIYSGSTDMRARWQPEANIGTQPLRRAWGIAKRVHTGRAAP